MNIEQALQYGISSLNTFSNNPQRDAEVLLTFILQKDLSWILSHGEVKLESIIEKKFKIFISQRRQHQPIAYITGIRAFYGHDFIVTPEVLIPRPETELLIDFIKHDFNESESLNIVDVGTGSGCLAITAAKIFNNSSVFALEKYPTALKIAQKNIEKHKIDNITLLKSNLLNNLPKINNKIDIILANLPYLILLDIKKSPTQKELLFEPPMALLAKRKGLDLIKKCSKQSLKILKNHGKLYLEMLPQQIPMFTSWIKRKKFPFLIQVCSDLSGQQRFVILTLVEY